MAVLPVFLPVGRESCLAGFPGAASWPPEQLLMETLRGPGFGREICPCPASSASDLSTLMFCAFRKKNILRPLCFGFLI